MREDIIKLAAEAALASGGIENEAGLMALELLKAKPEIGVAALHKLDSAITTDRAAA